ncbi:hypothetical protein LXL04_023801 [Taraxacum kok-saghyz]
MDSRTGSPVNLKYANFNSYSDFNVNLKCAKFNVNLNCTDLDVNLSCTDLHVNNYRFRFQYESKLYKFQCESKLYTFTCESGLFWGHFQDIPEDEEHQTILLLMHRYNKSSQPSHNIIPLTFNSLPYIENLSLATPTYNNMSFWSMFKGYIQIQYSNIVKEIVKDQNWKMDKTIHDQNVDKIEIETPKQFQQDTPILVDTATQIQQLNRRKPKDLQKHRERTLPTEKIDEGAGSSSVREERSYEYEEQFIDALRESSD